MWGIGMWGIGMRGIGMRAQVFVREHNVPFQGDTVRRPAGTAPKAMRGHR